MVTSQVGRVVKLVQVGGPSDGASGACERGEWGGVRDENMTGFLVGSMG